MIIRYVRSILFVTVSRDVGVDAAINVVILLAVAAVIQLFTMPLASTLLGVASDRVVQRARVAFVRNILAQELRWFDTAPINQLNTLLNDATYTWQETIGERGIGGVAVAVGGLAASIVLSALMSWKLSLIFVLGIFPLISILILFIFTCLAKIMARIQRRSAAAGAIAEETLAAVRTVVALGASARVIAEYSRFLDLMKADGVKESLSLSLVIGMFWPVIYIAIAGGIVASATLISTDREAVVANFQSSSGCAFAPGVDTASWALGDELGTYYGSSVRAPALCAAASGFVVPNATACAAECVETLLACVAGTSCMSPSALFGVVFIMFRAVMTLFMLLFSIKTTVEGINGAKAVVALTKRVSRATPFALVGDAVVEGVGGLDAADLVAATAKRVGKEADTRKEDDSKETSTASASTPPPLLRFENVRFAYPSRPTELVLRGVDLEVIQLDYNILYFML